MKETTTQKKTYHTKEKKFEKNSKEETYDFMQMVAITKGMGVAYGITCIFFLAYGILITYTEMSYDNLPLVALVTTAIASVVVGYDWAVCMKKKGIISGSLAGIFYTLILFLITFLVNQAFEWELTKLIMMMVSILAGAIGGILGANRKLKT